MSLPITLPHGHGVHVADRRHDRLAWLDTPANAVALLIVTSFCARLIFASSLGLGIDESYMVAAGRTLRLSYFDHPPIAWWLAWAASHIAGSEAALVVRLPFLLLFAVSTWLMFLVGRRLYDDCAGLWAACLLNASPVFGITSASWVLPDGPLFAALLGALLCVTHALHAEGRSAWGWWLGTGACLGLALCSKYLALLSGAGLLLYLVTEPRGRAWLARPQPYAAALLAAAVFSPVLIWNAEHGWVSLLFQGGRAGGGRWHLFGPLTTLGGEAIYVLPWIWLPLLVCLWVALRRGAAEPKSWLLACLALPPIALFPLLALHSHVLFHWAAPGYLMVFPLLGDFVSRHRATSRPIRVALVVTAILVPLGALLVASDGRFNWLPGTFTKGTDPELEAVDWTGLRTELYARGVLPNPGLVLAATRWRDAGKMDYAMHGEPVVLCLGGDPREYGLTTLLADHVGQDMLIVAPNIGLAGIRQDFGAQFDGIEALPGVMLRHAGRPALLLPLFLAHHFHGA